MTKDAAKPDQGSGLSVAGWPLRRKIALALAIPLLLAATLAGLRVQNDLADSSSASRSADQVTILAPAVDYLTSAETAMVAAQNDSAAAQGDLIDAIDDVIANSEVLEEARDNADLDDLQTAQVNALLDLSQSMRAEGAENLGPATWIALVRQLESSVSQLTTSVNAALTTPEPRLEQLSQAMSGRLSLAQQQGLVANTELAQSGSQELFSEVGVEAAAIDRLAGSVEGAEELTAELRTANTRHASEIRDDAATDLDGRDAYLAYDEIADQLISGVTASLTDAAADARRSAGVGAAVTLAALAAAVFLAYFIARTLLEPIGRVREGALAVARHRLPDAVARIRAGEAPEPIKPIDVTTNEEIGQVARAVDDLHRQAVHLASGEAQLRQTVNAMFVTLSRRSNSLVNQQLAQIERLEHDEEDPKRLESLFRLDHLASRMRRTADSLLILADAPNRAAGQFSLTVGEALQAATSGVQDYQRVQIMSHLGTRIGDMAAPDVVHLLTELVDNALSFSPPSEPVRLAAKLSADGAVITVTDSGLGVPPAELELLNNDLAHGAEATPDTARRMGLFVVSRLAERHGVVASLAKNPGGGMTATVVLPAAILPELPQSGTPAAPAARSAEPAPAKAAEPAATTAAPVTSSSTSETLTVGDAPTAGAKPELTKRRGLGRGRGDRTEKAAGKAAAAEARAAEREAKAAEKAAEKAARKEAAKEAELEPLETPAAAQATTEATTEPTPGRPSLESLLPRREPGANMPRTGADAFLPPETSSETGPLFGKRQPAADAPAEPAQDAPAASADAPGDSSEAPAAAEAAQTSASAPEADKVAPVVPITALASRQRAQAEEEARASEELTRSSRPDPLTDPLPTEDAETSEAPAQAAESAEESAKESTEQATEQARSAGAVSVDVNDPLGLDAPAAAETTEAPEAPDADAPAAATEAPAAPAAANGTSLPGGLPTRTRGSSPEINRDMPGLPPANGEPAARAGGDSPIFKSMRSGWLTGDGAGEFHETEVERGWEIAEQVAEETPVAESTPVGLPRRAPGERLVPGSVTTPEPGKKRDPEAMRRRLQAHTAGVSRGRRAAQSSPQPTEAGPA